MNHLMLRTHDESAYLAARRLPAPILTRRWDLPLFQQHCEKIKKSFR